jgi:hypothetical protein
MELKWMLRSNTMQIYKELRQLEGMLQRESMWIYNELRQCPASFLCLNS